MTTKLEIMAVDDSLVNRFWGKMKLKVTKGAVDLTRVKQDQVQLLADHDSSAWIGHVNSASVKDNKLYVEATLGDGELSDRLRSEMEQGRKGVSIGFDYDWDDLEFVTDKKDPDNSFTQVNKWELFEISSVTAPAIPSAKITTKFNMSEYNYTREHEVMLDAQPRNEDKLKKFHEGNMKELSLKNKAESEKDVKKGEGTNKQTEKLAIDEEETTKVDNVKPDSKKEIAELAKQYVGSIEGLGQDAVDFIAEDKTAEEFHRHITDKLATKVKVKPAPVGFHDGKTTVDSAEFSMQKIMYAMFDGGSNAKKDAEFELDFMQNHANRPNHMPPGEYWIPGSALNKAREKFAITISSDGGSIGTDVDRDAAFNYLRDFSMMLERCRLLTGARGDITLPVFTDSNTGSWVVDGAGVTEVDPTLTELKFTPKSILRATVVSDLSIFQSESLTSSFISENLLRVVAEGVDKAIISGSGTNQPTGLTQLTGTGNVATPGTLASQVDLRKLLGTLDLIEAQKVSGNKTLLMGIEARNHFRGQNFTGSGRTLMEAINDLPDVTVVPTSVIEDLKWVVAANTEHIYVAMWDGLALKVNPYTNDDAVRLIVRQWMDVKPVRNNLVAIAKFT